MVLPTATCLRKRKKGRGILGAEYRKVKTVAKKKREPVLPEFVKKNNRPGNPGKIKKANERSYA